jgi:hypothetical protein
MLICHYLEQLDADDGSQAQPCFADGDGPDARLLGFSKATPLLFKRASTRGIVNVSIALTKARQVRRPAGQPKSRLAASRMCCRTRQELSLFSGLEQLELVSPRHT